MIFNDLLAFLLLLWMIGFGLSVMIGCGLSYLNGTQSTVTGGFRLGLRIFRRVVIGMLRSLGAFLWQKIRRW